MPEPGHGQDQESPITISWKKALSGWKGPILGLIFGLLGAGIGSLFSDYVRFQIMQKKFDELCERAKVQAEILANTKIDLIYLQKDVQSLQYFEKLHSEKEKELDRRINDLRRRMDRSWLFKQSLD